MAVKHIQINENASNILRCIDENGNIVNTYDTNHSISKLISFINTNNYNSAYYSVEQFEIKTFPPIEADFSANFIHLKDVKADLKLSDSEASRMWEALYWQISSEVYFNERINLGFKDSYGNAQCAISTSSVLEGAAMKAGLFLVSELFSKAKRDADQFALTHQVEIMLKRLGFRMYSNELYVAPTGSIALMNGRYSFAGCSQHSGHIYSIYQDKGAWKFHQICDNGGYNHEYKNLTESFFVPHTVTPLKRSTVTPTATKKKVMLNAGHSGTFGARGKNKEIKEEFFTSLQVNLVKNILDKTSIQCDIVNQDKVGGLDAVGKAAKDYDIAISCHFNALDGKEHGTGYLGGQNKLATKSFAEKLCKNISETFGIGNLGHINISVTITNEFDKSPCPIAFLLETEMVDDEVDSEAFTQRVKTSANIIAAQIIETLK